MDFQELDGILSYKNDKDFYYRPMTPLGSNTFPGNAIDPYLPPNRRSHANTSLADVLPYLSKQPCGYASCCAFMCIHGYLYPSGVFPEPVCITGIGPTGLANNSRRLSARLLRRVNNENKKNTGFRYIVASVPMEIVFLTCILGRFSRRHGVQGIFALTQ